MINVFKSIVNAFSAYSFAPLPYYEEDGDRYRLAFVPFVGAIISVVCYGWFMLGWFRYFNDIVVALGMILVPIIITGGRHVLGLIAFVDSVPTYKYRFSSWSQSRDRGVLRFLITATIWVIAMVNTYDYIFPIIFYGFVLSRILMGLLSTSFNDGSNQSKAVIPILILELVYVIFCLQDEFENLVIAPLFVALIVFCLFIRQFRRCTAENLGLLEDDFVVTAETAWIFSVAMVNLVRSL